MDSASTKRRRFTSSTSNTSNSTQITNISEDSSQLASPTPCGPNMFERPVFRLDSQDDVQSPTTKTPSPNVTGMSPGFRTNRMAFDSGFEARRKIIKARRPRNGRRQSDSVIEAGEHHPSLIPHRNYTTTCMGQDGAMLEEINETSPKHLSFDGSTVQQQSRSFGNLDRIGYQYNENVHHARPAVGVNVPQHQTKQRANSVDASVGLRVLPQQPQQQHLYEQPEFVRGNDTEVYMGMDGPTVRMAGRKRLHSSISETPPELLQTGRKLLGDADSGYVRNANGNSGFCETLSSWLKRHKITILILFNLLLLFCNLAGLPYFAWLTLGLHNDVRVLQMENCFRCSEMPIIGKNELKDSGMLTEREDGQCCFQSRQSFTSWIVKEVSTLHSHAYLSGNGVRGIGGKQRIKWNNSRRGGTAKLSDDDTSVIVEGSGYYFIFTRVHYKKHSVGGPSKFTFSHRVMHRENGEGNTDMIGNVSESYELTGNSTVVEESLSVEAIRFLKDGDRVFVDIKEAGYLHANKKHTLGMFLVR